MVFNNFHASDSYQHCVKRTFGHKLKEKYVKNTQKPEAVLSGTLGVSLFEGEVKHI